MKKLMFVASSHGYNGENGDLFVIAEDKQEAIGLWRNQWELEDDAQPDRVFVVPAADLNGLSRALEWHSEVKEL